MSLLSVGFAAQAQATITIGDKNLESAGDGGNGNLLPAQAVTLSQSATIVSLSFYVTQASGSLILGVYDATGPGGHPGHLLAATSSFATANGWNTANVVSPVSLAAGNYWLAYLPSRNSLSFLKQNDSGNCIYQVQQFSQGMPATFATSTSDCSPTTWSFYATVVPSGGAVVNGVAPTITTQPQNQSVTAGGTVTFTVVASGTAPLSYQWSKNGAAIAAATSSSYTTPATMTGDNGSKFSVQVSNAAGGQMSNAATLTVNAPPPISVGDRNLEGAGDSGNGNLLPAQEMTLPQSATIMSLSFYVTQASGSLILGLYDATGPGGHPGRLLAVTSSVASVNGWNTANVTTPVSLAGGNYWLAYLPSSNSLSFLKQNDSGNCVYQAQTFSSGMPATFATSTSDCSPTTWSFYATVVPSSGGAVVGAITVSVTPRRAAATTSQTTQFNATVSGDLQNLGTTWAVDGAAGGNSTAGTISNSGLYTPGTQAGSHTITATSVADASRSAAVAIAVTDLAGVFTYHNDAQRTGVNPKEYALTTSTVNSSSFGLLFSCSVDAPGYVYSQPLYVANLTMNDGRQHNVLFVATESDWVYAYDADASSCQQLWRKRVLATGETTVNPADVNDTGDLTPEIGVTSTPVIDSSTRTLYVVSKSEDSGGGFQHRLYALDLATGNTKFGSPAQITATHFDVLTHMQRPALLLNNGTLYIAFGSHGDAGTYQGWVMGYSASTLAQQFVWSTTDPTSGNNQGAIWMYGNGPAVDSSGNVYVETANGVFDVDSGGHNYSDSVVKLSSSGAVLDYFAPFNQSMLAADDVDLGSSGPIVLPDSLGESGHPHLLLATGKTGMLYVLDRDNLGGYDNGGDNALQEVAVAPNDSSVGGGVFGQPVLFNGAVYVAANRKPIQRFTINTTSLSSTSQSQSAHSFTFRGVTPTASANGTSNGILWALDTSGDPTSGNPAPAVLFAFDAANLGTLLYSSPASGSGAAGTAIKSAVPTVANGKVYIGGAGTFSVFGLLPN
jgi:hypothetical protein